MAAKKEIIKPEPRTRVSQSDVPGYSIEKALSIAKAIGDNYAYKAVTPLDVASALGVIPTTGPFRMLTGASVAYGLTTAGWNAGEIGITPLGLRIVRPLSEDGDAERAKREAVLKPKVIGDFLRRYDGAALPKDEIARNVLITMGVPSDRTTDVFSTILDNAKAAGFLRRIGEKTFVDLKGVAASHEPQMQAIAAYTETTSAQDAAVPPPDLPSPTQNQDSPGRRRKVFITHGKNRALIEPIKKLLTFGDLEAVVSVHSQTASQPVPVKIMEEMRSCGAAIIHVENERVLVDAEGKQHVVLNDNVLIEIGAAMALFGSRFILVVKDGVELPSNLQGLLELRYKGETLDVNDTVSLLDAIADMKRRPLPL